jgi:dethiobiotin synthetase
LALELRDRNPYAFAPAIAPHLAAQETGQHMDLDVIVAARRRLQTRAAIVVVEGAGGVLVPLDERHDMLDLAARLELPVLLVVGLRLGCINHALLSVAAIRARGLTLAGWVANEIDPAMVRVDASVESIAARVGMSPAAVLRWHAPPGTVSAAMDKLATSLVSCWHGDRLR